MLIYLAGVGVLAVLQPEQGHLAGLPATDNLWLFTVTFSVTGGFNFIALLYFVRQRTATLRRLAEEQRRSEGLLLNILPAQIAAILKQGKRVIANQYAAASVLFADVVDFTPLSARMKAVEIVEILNDVFSHFDELADRYGLEKIKTIGDCYMVASGIPAPRVDHAQALVDMALDIQALVARKAFAGGQHLVFRIGIHSGPLAAGVIGRRKFIYDLWGDAVNTASRMESHGVPGAIQITRGTYELIKDEFDCRPMPPIMVKGKGEMEVWHVQKRRSPRGGGE
jgi:guanylate cyclase